MFAITNWSAANAPLVFRVLLGFVMTAYYKVMRELIHNFSEMICAEPNARSKIRKRYRNS